MKRRAAKAARREAPLYLQYDVSIARGVYVRFFCTRMFTWGRINILIENEHFITTMMVYNTGIQNHVKRVMVYKTMHTMVYKTIQNHVYRYTNHV